jgi:prepilin-type N-terminal cleavage/methylation domain-containing protein
MKRNGFTLIELLVVVAIIVLGLLWCNALPAKILNIENKIQIEVPSSHKFIKYENEEVRQLIEEFLEDYEGLEMDLYSIGPSKYLDLEKAILDGEDPMDNEYVQSIMKKFERKNFQDGVKAGKWMISEAKKIMKKEKIDFVTSALVLNESLMKLSAEEEGDEIADMINELKDMNIQELKVATKEIRKQMTTLSNNNKSIPVNENMTINLNKFVIAKNEYDNLFLKSSGKMIWIMGAIKLEVMLNLLLTEHNDKTYAFISSCFVNCSKFNTNFDKMTKPMFSTNVQTQKTKNSLSNDGDLTEQLKGLRELYKSGVLTKEEFTKAKKKLLN